MSTSESSNSSQQSDKNLMNLAVLDSSLDYSHIEVEEVGSHTATNESISIVITNDLDIFSDSYDSETYDESTSTGSGRNVTIIVESDSHSNFSLEDWTYGCSGAKIIPEKPKYLAIWPSFVVALP